MKRWIIAIIFTSYFVAHSQFKLDNWKSHSSIMKINFVSADANDNYWCATDGGIFKFDPISNSEIVYTNVESLLNNQISTVYYDKDSKRIYAGAKDGIIEIFADGKWLHISDIKNQKLSNSIINRIININGKIYIAGGFGLAIFDPINLVFKETIFKIGNFSINTPINDILIDDNKIWVATDEGIASADLSSFLPNPKSWTNYTVKEGLYQNRIFKITKFDNKLFLMSDRFILTYNGNTFEQFAESSDQFKSMAIINNSLYYTNIFKIYDYNKNELNIKHPDFIESIFSNNDSDNGHLIITYKTFGFGIFKNGELKYNLPNTPATNNIKDAIVDLEGNLWIASGFGVSSKGFSKYDGKKWTNYLSQFYPEIYDNTYHRINIDSKGRIIASNYGKGLLIGDKVASDSNYNFQLFNETNSEFRGLGTAPKFVVAGATAIDKNGRIWVTNLGEISNGPALLCFDYDGSSYKSYGFQNPRIPNQRTFMTIDIDPYGTKWLGGNNPSGTGLMYYNEMGTLSNISDDVSGVITLSNNPNLLDNMHNCITVDKNGMVWIGTPKGVAVINNPSQVLSNNGGPSNLSIRNLNRLIGDINVNDIMVDGLNNKWIATSNGVFVIDPLATDTIAYITMDNYPLPTNDVISLAYNPYTGKVYFGTNYGIYEANSLSIEPAPKYDISCYPQPFRPKTDLELSIDGLADNSEVRILTSSGELVNSINTMSRKTVWNGKDKNGNFVKSGIYIISAKSAISDVAGVQKIAIINE
ncbi:MAG TPA: hypothetical protein PLE30_03370 [Candidatus Kapabacteria bacterium]|nr:hypothetical protein [Candidatus Kapabacteria bacterium]